MRLNTDFHDYYDNAVGYGIDENVYYSRFTKEVEIRIKSQFNHNGVSGGLLGFCGTIYPFVPFVKYENSEIVDRYYAYNLEEYKNKASEWKNDRFNFISHRKFADRYRNTQTKRDQKKENQVKQFFIDRHSQNDEIFLEFKVPIWVFILGNWESKGLINPCLKDYGFERVKDSFTAFQEISMYLSNILI